MSTTYTPTCDDCGWTGKTTTHQGYADHALRLHSCDKQRAKDTAAQRRRDREAAVDRTPKPCHHKRANHQHGTHACYVLDRCRCTPCAKANTAYEHTRARLHAYGRFTHYVDAEPIREHVRSLTAAGMGLKRIVELSGYSQGAMTKLMYGSEGRGPSKRLLRTHAEKILAVHATPQTLAKGARIDGTGTRRRLQALMAIGWSQSKLARHLGYELRNFCMLMNSDRDVTVRTADRARELYDQLWNIKPPTATRGDKGAYTRSLGYAAARGWVPPMAWDDESIDDPSVSPVLDVEPDEDNPDVDEARIWRALTGERIELSRAERVEVVRRLAAQGFSDSAIAERVHVTPRTVMRDRAEFAIPSRWAA